MGDVGSWVSTTGLVLDAIGAFFVWKYTLQHGLKDNFVFSDLVQQWDETAEFNATQVALVPDDKMRAQLSEYIKNENSEVRSRKNFELVDATYRAWSDFGIVTLITGFSLQAIGVWL